MFKLAIIDFDGTLCGTHGAVRHVIDLTFASFGRPLPKAPHVEAAIGDGLSSPEVFGELLGLEPGDPLRQEWSKRYREIYNGGEGLARTTVFPGVVQGLQRLNGMGCRCIVLSNKGVVALRLALGHFALDQHFDMVLGDEPGFIKKPRPDTYRDIIAPRFSSVSASETFMLGDTVADLLYARNIGAAAFWARYGFGDGEACAALNPDLVLDSFGQAADYASARQG